jgi:prefoldin subunit 5
LTEDKIRLQQQVEALETQVSELARSRDDVHQQSSADGAQWRKIVAMSSQLQLKGADEARRFRVERESWDRERVSLQKRIEELESVRKTVEQLLAGQKGLHSCLSGLSNSENWRGLYTKLAVSNAMALKP